MPKKPTQTPKYKYLNVRVTEDDYKKINDISEKLGVSISAMLRIILTNQFSKVDKSGDPSYFLHGK